MNSYFFFLQIGIWKVLVHRTTPGEENWCLSLLRAFTCLSKYRKGQWQLVFALRQERDSNATTDALHLAGVLVGLADPSKNLTYPPPVLLFHTKLTQATNVHTWAQRTTIFTDKAVKRCDALTSISTMEWAKFRYSGNGAPGETL